MSNDQLNVTVNCGACGADPATLTYDDTMGDSALVSCKNCGQEFGTYGDVKAKAMEAAKAEVASMIKDALKGFQ